MKNHKTKFICIKIRETIWSNIINLLRNSGTPGKFLKPFLFQGKGVNLIIQYLVSALLNR